MSLDDFINFAAYGNAVDHLLGQKREDNEEQILHAQRFIERYKGKDLTEAINLRGVTEYDESGGPIKFRSVVLWIPPSTKGE